MTTSIRVTTMPWAPQPDDELFVLDERCAAHLAELGRPCLSAAIRAYGDHAVFNRIQIPELVRDLVEVAQKLVNDGECQAQLFALAEFIQNGVERIESVLDSTQKYVVALAD